jgi:hypothetical protein
MLIEKKKQLSVNDVVVLKLTSGTEIVARLVNNHDGDNIWSITKPLVAQPHYDETGIGLSFIPFSLTARDDEEFTFAMDRLILTPYLANDQVKQTYLQSTSSLSLPPVSKLITGK